MKYCFGKVFINEIIIWGFALFERAYSWLVKHRFCPLWYRIIMGYLEQEYFPDTNIVLLRVDFHDNLSHYHDMSKQLFIVIAVT